MGTHSKWVEQVSAGDDLLAIIVKNDYKADGIEFFTSADLSQQLAYMHHPKGKVIGAHVHKKVTREVRYTQEVLVIKTGKLRVDFYDSEKCYRKSRILGKGDVILLVSGGHGFEVLEELEMFEIKQGPFLDTEDKIRFQGVPSSQVRLK
jgi:hypothetical protein